MKFEAGHLATFTHPDGWVPLSWRDLPTAALHMMWQEPYELIWATVDWDEDWT